MSKFADILREIRTELFYPVPCLQCKSYKTSCPRTVYVKDLVSNIKDTVKNPKKIRRSHSFSRPYFTIWMILVDTLVIIAALCSFSFAPLGATFKKIKKPLLRHNLAYETVTHMQQENFWIGPQYDDLIHLGAKYAPCMRDDIAVLTMVEAEKKVEDETGCCVRKDLNVCWQTLAENCTSAFCDFYEDKVCGVSRKFCKHAEDSINDTVWKGPKTTWPNCRVGENRSRVDREQFPALACEVAARPCCFGLQGQCAIISEEECAFRNGYFHPHHSLCSQVDCVKHVCGIDVSGLYQFYRFFLPTFIHGGILHLLTSLLFLYFIVWPYEEGVGWWRTALVYILSGTGGTLLSGLLTPYQPMVGASSSLFGIIGSHIARDIIKIREWRKGRDLLREHQTRKMLCWLGICVILLIPGLLPWIDNWAHVGGLVFGFLVSMVTLTHEVPRCTGDYLIRITVRIVLACFGVLAAVLLTYLFYYKQDLNLHLGWFNCIPFTSDFCKDSCMELQPRVENV